MVVLCNAQNGALGVFQRIAKYNIASGLQVSGSLQSTLGVQQVSGRQLECLGFVSTASRNHDSSGLDNVRNGAFGVNTNLVKRVILASIRDHRILVETNVGRRSGSRRGLAAATSACRRCRTGAIIVIDNLNRIAILGSSEGLTSERKRCRRGRCR